MPLTIKECLDLNGKIITSENNILCDFGKNKIDIANSEASDVNLNEYAIKADNISFTFASWLIFAAMGMLFCIGIGFIFVNLSIWWNSPLLSSIDIGSLQWYHIFDFLYGAGLYINFNVLWWKTLFIVSAVISAFWSLIIVSFR